MMPSHNIRFLFDEFRNSSLESFIVCENFKGGEYFNLPLQGNTVLEDSGLEPAIVPFLACGDLSGWGETMAVMDSDKSYEPPSEYISPVQPPIEPPHKAEQGKVRIPYVL